MHWVHVGKDGLSAEVEQELRHWRTRASFVPAPNGFTNRGLNWYDEHSETRHFKHLHSPPNRVEEHDLQGELVTGDIYHLICNPARCRLLCNALKRYDRELGRGRGSSQIMIWEPNEGDCESYALEDFKEALNYVDFFSPNLAEMGSLYRRRIDLDSEGGRQQLRDDCEDLLSWTKNRDIVIVVRLGGKGCHVQEHPSKYNHRLRDPGSPSLRAETPFTVPACEPRKVVDVTGAGNAFLGGFAYGLFRYPYDHRKLGQLETAALCGTVAASFAIEQVGMPKLEYLAHSEKKPSVGSETWNGEVVEERYMRHVTMYLENKMRSNPDSNDQSMDPSS